jgi:hypothetical protein
MGNNDNLNLAINNNDYMFFTVSPSAGFEMDLTSFTFRTRSYDLGNSAERWALFSSVDGFTSGDQIQVGRTTNIHQLDWYYQQCRDRSVWGVFPKSDFDDRIPALHLRWQ